MAAITVTTAAAVIEEVVSLMVQDTLIQESVMIPMIMDMSGDVRPGMDTLKIPRLTALSVVDKTADTALTPAVPTVATDDLLLTSHKAIAFRLEDIANIQSKIDLAVRLMANGMRSHAAKVDDDIISEIISSVSTAAPDHLVAFQNNPTNTLDKADFTNSAKLLDLQNVPRSDRFLVIPPLRVQEVLDVSNFIEADKFGDRSPIRNGFLGFALGFNVAMANSASMTGSENEAIFFHRSCCAYATQQRAKLDRERKALELADDFVLSQIYGVKGLDAGVRQVVVDTDGV